MVLLDQISGDLLASELPSEALDLVFKNVREALEEDEGEDVVLELGGVQGTPNGARCLPEPPFESRYVQRSPALGQKGTFYVMT
jgi:hypothetical protein